MGGGRPEGGPTHQVRTHPPSCGTPTRPARSTTTPRAATHLLALDRNDVFSSSPPILNLCFRWFGLPPSNSLAKSLPWWGGRPNHKNHRFRGGTEDDENKTTAVAPAPLARQPTHPRNPTHAAPPTGRPLCGDTRLSPAAVCTAQPLPICGSTAESRTPMYASAWACKTRCDGVRCYLVRVSGRDGQG